MRNFNNTVATFTTFGFGQWFVVKTSNVVRHVRSLRDSISMIMEYARIPDGSGAATLVLAGRIKPALLLAAAGGKPGHMHCDRLAWHLRDAWCPGSQALGCECTG